MGIETKKFTSEFDEVKQVIEYLKNRGISFVAMGEAIGCSEAQIHKVKNGMAKVNTKFYLRDLKEKFSAILAEFYNQSREVSNAEILALLIKIDNKLDEAKNNIKK